jgi:hypothetical protein
MSENEFLEVYDEWALSLKKSQDLDLKAENAVPLELYVKQISRDGLVNIEFNQEIVVPDFAMQA